MEGAFEIPPVLVLNIAGAIGVGKTTLARFITDGEYKEDFLPQVLEACNRCVMIKGEKRYFSTYDTGNLDEIERERIRFSGVDVVILCFNQMSRNTLVDIEQKIVPFYKSFAVLPSFILLACKFDLCNEEDVNFVGNAEVTAVAERIGALRVLKFSSKEFQNDGYSANSMHTMFHVAFDLVDVRNQYFPNATNGACFLCNLM